MDDAIQTDLNLSSLSVSSPSVSSCSATLPFPVYYCKNSDLISVFARYVDPKWILFWLFWLDWRRQKKLKRDLFFSFFFFSHRIIRGKLLSCLQNHQDNSGLLNEWTKATICSLSKALSWWPKTSSSSLNGYTPPIQGGRASFPTMTIMSMAKKIPPNSQFRNQNINKNSSADWSVWNLFRREK